MPLYNSYVPVVKINKGAPTTSYTASADAFEVNTTAQTTVDGNGYGNTPITLLSNHNAFGGTIFGSNQSSGGSASTDIVLYNNAGTALAGYVDVGINSSGFNDPNYTINGPNEMYLLGNGANLSVGVGTAHDIKFHTGGTLAANEKLRLKNAGNLILNSMTATPAGGATAAMLQFGTTAGFGIYFGSGVPTVTAGQGSLYLRSDGSSTSTRMYVNTTGSTVWTAVTTAT